MTSESLGRQLGQAISARRRARGLTQDDLAGLVDVDAETISRMERGASIPSLQRLLSLAAALGIGVGELLSEASALTGDRASRLGSALEKLSERDQILLLDFAALLLKR